MKKVWWWRVVGWGPLAVETSLWTLIWIKELRYWVILAGVLLHICIDLTMSLPIFEMLFVIAYVVFVDPDDLVRLGNWIRSIFTKPKDCKTA